MNMSGMKLLAFGCVLSVSVAAFGQRSTLKPLLTGAMPKMGGYMPQRLALTDAKPTELKVAPADLKAPMYGVLKMGSKTFLVIVDRPEGGDSRLFVDTNGDGDLTNEAAVPWKKAQYKGKAGQDYTRYTGNAMLGLGLGGSKDPASIGVYIFDKNDADREQLKNVLLYYTDYAYEGEVKVGTKAYKAMLTDDMARGDFRGMPGERSGVRLFIDVNGNGKFDKRGESYDVTKPFNIGGTTYEIKGMTVEGGSFEVVTSSQTVAEILPPPDLTPGKKALEFKAKTLDGKAVNFPASYKGKIVMLDFWATWCGPCIGEMPNVIDAYNKYHDKGFEILGISLDNEKSLPGIQKFMTEHKMAWPQVADGKYWDAEIAKLYVVQSIPAAYLIDGDTGEVLAEGNAIRGEGLAKAIEAALAKKKLGK
jgi:peroxiredoxin